MPNAPETLMNQALELMALGMGTVFTFLGILVVATTLMSRVLGRLYPVTEPPATRSQKSPSRAATTSIDSSTRSAIEMAIQRYRQDHS